MQFIEWFEFKYNKSLKSLPNFEFLDTIGAVFRVIENENLEDIEGITNCKYFGVGSLFNLSYNPKLSVCSYENICNYIQEKPGAIIADNAPGCMHKYEVFEGCGVPTKDEEFQKVVKIYPNPFTYQLRVDLEQKNEWTIKILNINGSVYHQESFIGAQHSINLERLPNGVYILLVSSKEKLYHKKILKMK